MSDEEKKAVDKINKLVEYLRKWNENVTIVPADIKYFEKILDMIETYIRMIDENIEEILEQSKEIEELKKYKKYYEEMEEVNKKFIAVDKIKAKIEEYKKQQKEEPDAYLCIKVLRSLLQKE